MNYNPEIRLMQVAATPDLMLAYIDVFLGGDEKRPDLPPKLMQRLPLTIIFGGEGSYMAPYSLHSDNLLTSLIGQVNCHDVLNERSFYPLMHRFLLCYCCG